MDWCLGTLGFLLGLWLICSMTVSRFGFFIWKVALMYVPSRSTGLWFKTWWHFKLTHHAIQMKRNTHTTLAKAKSNKGANPTLQCPPRRPPSNAPALKVDTAFQVHWSCHSRPVGPTVNTLHPAGTQLAMCSVRKGHSEHRNDTVTKRAFSS